MPTININVNNKVARWSGGDHYVCGNSDYVVEFDFDREWDAYSVKTARFKYNGAYQDVVFTGRTCAMPQIMDSVAVQIGVFAGELHTTTAAIVPALRSILDGEGVPEDPAEDVYSQLMELLNGIVNNSEESTELAREAAEIASGAVNTANRAVDTANRAVDTADAAAQTAAAALKAASEKELPAVTEEDDDKVLQAEDGQWKAKKLIVPWGSIVDVPEISLALPLVEAVTADIEPETYTAFGKVDSLEVNLLQKNDELVHEYTFEFIPSENFTGLTVTPEVKWVSTPVFPPGKTCQISVMRGVGILVYA